MYRSATLKLTLWYLALVMAISLLFSGVVYHVAQDELARGLSNQTARIYRQYPVFTNDPFFLRDNDVTLGSRHILINLLYLNIAVLVGAGFASYWLARRTLGPIAEANERQKQFVADASHELRTPITALRMETEVTLMDTAASKDELRAVLQSNLEEAAKLESLLNSLLRLSKLDSDALSATFTGLNVADVVAEATHQIEQQAAAKQIEIVSDYTQQLPAIGDRDSLEQLFVILLDNAVKYSPEKSTITISSKRTSHEITVFITDKGIGIEPDALDHVFDRFYRADKARTSNNGFGLGLAIAKHIADMHHGAITIKSTPGKGTKASLSLPLVQGEPHRTPQVH